MFNSNVYVNFTSSTSERSQNTAKLPLDGPLPRSCFVRAPRSAGWLFSSEQHLVPCARHDCHEKDGTEMITGKMDLQIVLVKLNTGTIFTFIHETENTT